MSIVSTQFLTMPKLSWALTYLPLLTALSPSAWQMTSYDNAPNNSDPHAHQDYLRHLQLMYDKIDLYNEKTRGMTDEQRLVTLMFRDYNSHARPTLHFEDPVTVYMSMTLTQIFELDEKNQVLITNAWTRYEWFDQYLRWRPQDFSNLTSIRIPSNTIWKPDIVLYNSAADFSQSEMATRVHLTNNGKVIYNVPKKLYSSCKIDVTYFPFDEQLCKMKFGSWTYDGFKVDLVNASNAADLTFYVQNGEWDLVFAEERRNVVIYSCCVEPYPDVTFYIHIKRKSLYYFINVFIPCFILSSLTLLIFLLPVESGEKCGLGIAIMLGFAVFMLSVIEKLPETSESIPLISMYVSGVLSLTAISICCTVGVLAISYRGTSNNPEMPKCLVAIVKFLSKKRNDFETFMNKSLDYASRFAFAYSRATSHASLALQHENELTREIVVGMNRLAERHSDDVDNQKNIENWQTLAKFVDCFLFCTLTISIVLFSFYIFVYAPALQASHLPHID